MYPLYESLEGSFQELVHCDDVKFGQLSLLKVKSGCARGGHYHTRKQEWFCCIRGKCVMEIANVKDYSSRSVIMNETKAEFLLINPYEYHLVRNFSKSDTCELLIIASEIYNPEDADTFEVRIL